MSAPALTPEECERGYNNRAAVPDFARYFQRWAADSASARAALRPLLDLRYGPRPKATLDLFVGGGRRGLLVFIHGGYWRALDKSEHAFVAPPFVAAGLSNVTPPGYRSAALNETEPSPSDLARNCCARRRLPRRTMSRNAAMRWPGWRRTARRTAWPREIS